METLETEKADEELDDELSELGDWEDELYAMMTEEKELDVLELRELLEYDKELLLECDEELGELERLELDDALLKREEDEYEELL